MALTNPDVKRLPAWIFPEAEIPPPDPLVINALPYTLPAALTNPGVKILPEIVFPTTDILPAVRLPLNVGK